MASPSGLDWCIHGRKRHRATTASNCRGQANSGNGLHATVATNCVGCTSSGAIALNADATASFCRGTNSGGSTAINAHIAIACTAGGGAIAAPGGKFLGTL